jgi:signal transduction histidine kinase/FixJ family two-component response regulator
VADQVLVLLVEDDDVDAELITRALANALPGVQVEHARTSKEYLERLATGGFDAIVSDSSMLGCEGMSALHLARDRHPNVPFIYISGTEDPNRDVRGLHALGVKGLLTKAQLGELSPLLQRSVEEARQSAPEASQLESYERLIGVLRELSFARSLPAVMAIVRRAARELTGAEGATFVLREGDSCYYADEDAIGPLWKEQRFPMMGCIAGWTMKHRQPAVVEDVYKDPRVPVALYETTFVQSEVTVPIRAMAPVGAIGTYWSRRRLPEPHEVRLLQALADATATAIENVHLYETLEARARERMAELETLAHAVSHDLRTPIRHAGAYASILMDEEGARFAPEARQKLEIVIDAVGQLGRMVDALLELSQTGRAPLRRQPLDLAVMAQEVAAHYQLGSGPAVEFVVPVSLPATGDRTLLRIALRNLLSNAWKFSSKCDAPRVEVGVQTGTGGEPVYFVRDNGAGFDEQATAKLFGLFQRFHEQSEFPGTGIGLASVQRIIEKHGGNIWAAGTPGQGATFYFTLGEKPR